jgi:ribosomal protein S18 acetylase RimI-like enzyme
VSVAVTIAVKRLADGMGVYAAAPGNPLIALEGAEYGARAAWSTQGGFAFVGPAYEGPGWWLTTSGSPKAVRALVDAALAERGDELAGLTVPRGVPIGQWDVADGEHSEWDLMLATAPPPLQPHEASVIAADDPLALQAFLDRVSPTHSVRAEDSKVLEWACVVEGDQLIAVGALVRRPSGAAYLASIATSDNARGRGLGTAVTAYLTRGAFASGASECILAHYHPNEAARRIYVRLGYRTTHRCTSAEFRR